MVDPKISSGRSASPSATSNETNVPATASTSAPAEALAASKAHQKSLLDLSGNIADLADDGDWKKVNFKLATLNRSLAAAYGSGAMNNITIETFDELLSDLESTAESAKRAYQWKTLDYILAILSLGIFAVYKSMQSQPAQQVEDRARKLLQEITQFKEGHAHDIYDGGQLLKPITTPTTAELAYPAVSRYLVNQQEIFRDPKTRLDGLVDTTKEMRVLDPGGNALQWTPELLEQTGLAGVDLFAIQPDGTLQISTEASSSYKGISGEQLDSIARAVVALAEQGYDVRLSNPAGGATTADLVLHSVFGEINQAVARLRAADRKHLFFDRAYENVPDLTPPQTFGQVMDGLCESGVTDEEFNRLNGALADAWRREKKEGLVADDLTFLHYKLQFISIEVPTVSESGLRWHDGDGRLNAVEWAFFHLKVADLPQKEQTYYWCEVKWKDRKGKEQKDSRLIASDKKPATVDSIKATLAKDGWGTDKLTITIDGEIYTLPGKDDVLPAVENFSTGQIRALRTNETNAYQAPANIPLDKLSDPKSLKKAQQSVSQDINRWVMNTALTSWVENSGNPIRDLLKPTVPDTQRVFLRQSNGAENADFDIGQTDVIDSGNDTGAFGKCAPISFFSAAVCGISTAGRDAIETLAQSPDQDISATATRMKDLLTHVPMDESNRVHIHRQLQALRTLTLNDPSADIHLKRIEQLITSFIDQLTVKEDAVGPYLEMNFYIPDLSRDSYMRRMAHRVRTGNVTAKVRPRDIQEYIEHTNRADTYRGGKQHMMDFFKDPSSMNRLELMNNLGVGLIAAGVDKALKDAGKKNGLLFGPAGGTVASMIYGKTVRSAYMKTSNPAGKAGTPPYKKAFEDRRKRLLHLMDATRNTGGAIAVSMGYNSDTGHVNFVQDWGTPSIAGVEINAEALARTHMNFFENSASSSAWNNDRVNYWGINPTKIVDGLNEINQSLKAAGKTAQSQEVERLISLAQSAENTLITIAEANATGSGRDAIWAALDDDSAWNDVMNADSSYKDEVRIAAAQTMEFFKSNLILDRSDKKNIENVVLMPSNTERDDSLSDNPGDRDRVGGGALGSQAAGSANASDASYFVPINALAGGWDNDDPEKVKRYANYSDKTDYFIMLQSMTCMLPRQ
jgi:hypothetical protein